jgi:hypothetical protein
MKLPIPPYSKDVPKFFTKLMKAYQLRTQQPAAGKPITSIQWSQLDVIFLYKVRIAD